MSVNINVSGESADEVLSELGTIARALTGQRVTSPAKDSAPAEPSSAKEGAPDPQADKPARRTRAKAEPAPAPETPVDEAEVEEQDAADEQAEVEETRDAKEPLTLEDVKAAMSGYVKAFGMSATQEDGPKIFVEALGAPPAGEPYWKLSLLADADQAQLAKVVDTWKQATAKNPLKRAAV